MKKSLLCIAVGFLSGCGGGGDSASPSAAAPVKVATTALKDNTVPDKTVFKQFSGYPLQLPDKTARFKGKDIYIKLYTNDGKTLFLGRYIPAVPLSLHVPNHVKQLKADIFSTEPTDPQLTEEIVL